MVWYGVRTDQLHEGNGAADCCVLVGNGALDTDTVIDIINDIFNLKIY